MHLVSPAVWRIPRLAALFIAVSCGGDQPVEPPPEPTPTASCAAGGINLTSLPVFQGATVRGADLTCIRLSGDAEYVVTPQFLGAALPYAYQPFSIGTPDVPAVSTFAAALTRSDLPDGATLPAQQQLHALVRASEARLSATTDIAPRTSRLPITAGTALRLTAADPQRAFSVLSSLTDPPRFANVSAGLRYSGQHVLLYMDDRAATAYSDAEFAALGALFDNVLYTVDRDAFGQESDIDGNGRIIVLFTPTVNALVAASDCATLGFATGFFYGYDLTNASPQSNRGEIFYAMVPDAAGTFSCAHTKAQVSRILPTTFVHEFQHMISYGHHVLARGRQPETAWLNEGLSHMAEELASKYYETRYPAPTGRANPSQLFPDSAESFVTDNLINSYRYLRSSEQYSVTACAPGSFCSTPERGGAWLFLRWLSDVTGDPRLFDRLVHGELQGTRNVEAVAGRPFADLFSDFSLAVWSDSLVGSPRASTAPVHRLATRNLRRVYSALFDAYGPLGGIPSRYPITPFEIVAGARLRSAMRPGSLQTFRLRTPAGRSEAPLSLSDANGAPFGAAQGAQLSILRVPAK